MLKQLLKDYTHKRFVVYEKRCNTAILHSLMWAKKQGYTRLLIPDEGGWLTYEQYGEKLGFEIVFFQTARGLIQTVPDVDKNTAVLYHSLPGYYQYQNCKELAAHCQNAGALFIEDITGSISLPVFGDIIVCSFGGGKPVNLGTGGFAAMDDEDCFSYFQQFEIELDEKKTVLYVRNMPIRLRFLRQIAQRVTHELSGAICDAYGIVVIVPYKTDGEKQTIISYCEKNNYEYTQCPRYIRTNQTAISIEIKRLTQS